MSHQIPLDLLVEGYLHGSFPHFNRDFAKQNADAHAREAAVQGRRRVAACYPGKLKYEEKKAKVNDNITKSPAIFVVGLLYGSFPHFNRVFAKQNAVMSEKKDFRS